MPPDAKTSRGQRGFPTPNEMPLDGGYLVFRIPKDNEYVGLLLGAAELLTQPWNYYQWGDLTPQEAASKWDEIVNQAPLNFCGCRQPNGSKILRLNSAGHIQELGDDGEWQEPTGDYAIPPVTARTEPTSEERRCLAAANAVYVLQQVYEQISDAVAEGADEAEALAILIAAFAIQVGAWLGLAIAALVGVALAAFYGFIEIVEFMTADLWTTEFSDALECFFYECSLDTDGVVTFDFQCIREKMAEYSNDLDPNFITNLRLFGQVDFMLYQIGIDGLNLAGTTTEIEVADCSECEDEWCYAWDKDTIQTLLEVNAGTAGFTPKGHYVSGVGFVSDHSGNAGIPAEGETLEVQVTLPAGTYANVRIRYEYRAGDGTQGMVFFGTDAQWHAIASPEEGENYDEQDISLAVVGDILYIQFQPSFNVGAPPAIYGEVTLTDIAMRGYGTNPFGENNCVF